MSASNVDVTSQLSESALANETDHQMYDDSAKSDDKCLDTERCKQKKRGRKSVVPEYAKGMSPEDIQKERNKRNAKKSRKKKKSYIETLEKKVVDLESELHTVKAELTKFKAKEHFYQTGDKSGYIELIKTQELLKDKGPELFLKTKDSALQCLSYLSATYGADGIERRKVIKNAFKVILDNIIPDTHKPFIFHIKCQEEIPRNEFAEKLKRLKATKKASNELSEKEKVFYELLLALDLDKDQKKMFKVKSDELSLIVNQYQSLIKTIINTRKNLLCLGKKLKNNLHQQYSMLKGDQILNFLKYFREYEHSDQLKFHNLWNVKRKRSISDESKDDEAVITASDVDEGEMDEVNIDEDIANTLKIFNSIKSEAQKEDTKMGEQPASANDQPNLVTYQHNAQEEVGEANEFVSPSLPNVDPDLLGFEQEDLLMNEPEPMMDFSSPHLYGSLY